MSRPLSGGFLVGLVATVPWRGQPTFPGLVSLVSVRSRRRCSLVGFVTSDHLAGRRFAVVRKTDALQRGPHAGWTDRFRSTIAAIIPRTAQSSGCPV